MRIYITSWKRGHDALSINKIESVIKCVGFPCGSAVKESACNAGDLGSIPGLGRSPGEGTGYPLQNSGLENAMDYTVHGVAKGWTWLSAFHSDTHTHTRTHTHTGLYFTAGFLKE